MSKRRPLKPMFSLSPVEFRNSGIAGRGVFARRRFEPGDLVVAYAPRQRKVGVGSAEAEAAAETKLTLLSEKWSVIIPDTSVPGGWLCNHSCNPNAAIFSSGEGRIECARTISPGEEVTIFYGWVSQNDPARDPCGCGSPRCRGFINFDLTDEDVRNIDGDTAASLVVRQRLAEYGAFLESIGQAQVEETIASTLLAMKSRMASGDTP
jgi:SET domain-containing protein